MSYLLGMSKSLLGKPGFSSNKIGGKLSCIISRRLRWMVQMGRRTSRRHYSLVNFKQPVGRDHWPSCWHGSYMIIYNPPQSLQPSVDSHRAMNTNDIHLMLWSIWRISKPTPRVVLRLGGYNGMTQQKLAGFNKFKNSRLLKGKITRPRRLLLD